LLTEKRQLRRLFKDIDENYEKTVGLFKKLIKYQNIPIALIAVIHKAPY
jgi:hypothetical protein